MDKHVDEVTFTLGWHVHLPKMNEAGEPVEENITAQFEMGPGQAPTGELLWSPNADDMNYYTIGLRAYVSQSSRAPYGDVSPDVRARKGQEAPVSFDRPAQAEGRYQPRN